MVGRSLDLTGLKQGRLTILKKIPANGEVGGHRYICGCYCGNLVTYTTSELRHKHSARKSCGRCKDPTNYHKEYSIYTGVLQRCTNPNNVAYANYGGRGIKVCSRWYADFLFFFEDMGFCPSPLHSLDRIDVNGNYEPSNCRWATATEQASNKRKVYYEHDIVQTLTRLIEENRGSETSLEEAIRREYNIL